MENKNETDSGKNVDEEKTEVLASGVTRDSDAEEVIVTDSTAPLGTRKKVKLRREVKMALGAGVTAILVVMIIIIVAVAVGNIGRITQLYNTNFSYVDKVVRNDKYIANIKGEYALMEGDHMVAGKFTALEFNSDINGYTYANSDGSWGLLDENGKELFVTTEQILPPYHTVARFSREVVTINEGEYKTYRLSDMTEIEALRTVAPAATAKGGKWFSYLDGKYLIFEKSSTGAGVKVTTMSGASVNIDELGADTKLVRVAGEKYLVMFGSNHAAMIDGASVVSGSFQSVVANGLFVENTAQVYSMPTFMPLGSNFYRVDKSVYNEKLEKLEVVTDNMTVAGSALIINGAAYTVNAEGLSKKLDNVTIINDGETQAPKYLQSGDALYTTKLEEVTRAADGNSLVYLCDGFVRDGEKVRNFSGTKTLYNVAHIALCDGDKTLFLMNDKSIRTIDEEIYSAEKAAKYGELMADSGVKTYISCLSYGYLIETSLGYYVSGDSFFGKEMTRSVAVIGEYNSVVVVFEANAITSYKATKRGLSKLEYTYMPKVNSEYQGLYLTKKKTLIFERDGKFGVINDSGKIIVDPQFDSVECYDNFWVASIGSGKEKVSALLSLSGNALTKFEYTNFEIVGDYCVATSAKGEFSLVNKSGKGALAVIKHQYLINKTYKNGIWENNDESMYLSLQTDKGFRVLRAIIK